MENNLTREETTADQYLKSVGQNMYHDNDDFSIVYTISEVKEAIRLSKIETLKEAVENTENIKEGYLPSSAIYFVLTLVIEKLNSQIKDLTHGK